MKKRFVSLMLVLAMVFTMLPAFGITVSAQEGYTLLVDAVNGSDSAPRADNAVYKTFEGALAAAVSGDTVKLSTEAELAATVTVSKKLTLDLNGNKLKVPFNTTIQLDENADLTVTGNGFINTRQQMFTMTGGKLTVVNGTYTKDSDVIEGGLINCKGGGTVLIKGGTFKISVPSDKSNYAGFLLYSGGQNSKITVEAGEFILAPSTNFKPLFFGTDTVGEILIKGGNWVGEDFTYAVAALRSVTVKGGTFDHIQGKAYSGNTAINLADYLPAGYHFDGNTVKPDENFKVGSTYYPTLNEAVAEAQANDTVTVNKDAAVTQLVNIQKELTLDLNGKTLTLSTTNNSRAIDVLAGGKLTVKDSSTAHTGLMKTETLPRLLSVNGGELIVESGTFEAAVYSYKSYVNVIFCEGGTVTLNGGTYRIPGGYGVSGDESRYSSVIAATQNGTVPATVTVNDGTYTGAKTDYFTAKTVTSFKNGDAAFGTIQVKGGTFNGSFDISSADNLACIDITGGRFDQTDLIAGSYVSTLYDVIDSASYYIVTESGTPTYYLVTPNAPVAEIAREGKSRANQYASLAQAIKDAGTEPVTLTLLKNVTEDIEIPAGADITLDLAGNTLTGTGADSVVRNNGTFTLKDSSTLQTGVLTGGEAHADAGGAVRNAAGCTFTMQSGTIKSCKAEKGGAVSVAAGGSFVMNGGVITDCTATYVGGAVFNYKGIVTVKGSIKNCSATEYGGAIFNSAWEDNGDEPGTATLTLENGALIDNCKAEGGTNAFGGGIFNKGTLVMNTGAVIQNCKATKGAAVHNDGNTFVGFTMNGGEIKNNTAAKSGGGVQNSKKATFAMKGGAITGNTVTDGFGGGVFNSGSLSLSGNAGITGNTVGTTTKKAGNLAIVKGYPIALDNFTGSPVGVTLIEKDAQLGAYVFAFGVFTTETAEQGVAHFKSDNGGYGIDFVDEGIVFVDHPVIVCSYTKPLECGKNLQLAFDELRSAGSYTLTKTYAGYTVWDEEARAYIAYGNEKLVETRHPYVWLYNGTGLYVKGAAAIGSWWQHFFTGRVRNVYLTVDAEGILTVTTAKTAAAIAISADTHTCSYTYLDTDTHTVTCENCGHTETESHTYGEDHTCVCGAYDPLFAGVTDVKVAVNHTSKWVGVWYFKHLQTRYTYNITPVCDHVTVAEVAYSFDGETGWKTGTTLQSSMPLFRFYIRVTDSNGVDTDWLYQYGKVTQIVQGFQITYTEETSGDIVTEIASLPTSIKAGEPWYLKLSSV